MPEPVSAITVGANLLGSFAQADAASSAANSQAQSSAAGIAETGRQFDALRALLKPYTDVGAGAIQGQSNLLGLSGAGAQQTAVSDIESSPLFAALTRQGETGILQNASATGGLRGGNTQVALSQFRPQMLQGLIDKQLANLAGLASVGQNAAAGVGNAGIQTGQSIAGLLQQQGAARAGGQIAAGNAFTSGIGGIGGVLAGAFGRAPTYQDRTLVPTTYTL